MRTATENATSFWWICNENPIHYLSNHPFHEIKGTHLQKQVRIFLHVFELIIFYLIAREHLLLPRHSDCSSVCTSFSATRSYGAFCYIYFGGEVCLVDL